MIDLSEKITFESSERSFNTNWVSNRLEKAGFVLIAFEGYTIQAGKVSLLLDRALFSGLPVHYTPANLLARLRSKYGRIYDFKVRFSEFLKVPWYFLCYQYNPEKAILVEPTLTDCRIIREFSSIVEFGQWTQTFRDMRMLSPYEESDLPRIDQILRGAGIPWPGNLDTLLFSREKLLALVEFQNTRKATVKDHCNNAWFLPSAGRKGDINRWKALDVIRLHANLPLLIIVWSQREPDTIKFKRVEDIIYRDQHGGKTPGLYYTTKKLVTFEGLVQEIHALK